MPVGRRAIARVGVRAPGTVVVRFHGYVVVGATVMGRRAIARIDRMFGDGAAASLEPPPVVRPARRIGRRVEGGRVEQCVRLLRCAGVVDRETGRAGRRRGTRCAAVVRWSYGDGHLHRPSEPPGQRLGDRRTHAGLDDISSKRIRHRHERGVLDEREEPGEAKVGALLRGGDPLRHLVGRGDPNCRQVDHVCHLARLTSSAGRLLTRWGRTDVSTA